MPAMLPGLVPDFVQPTDDEGGTTWHPVTAADFAHPNPPTNGEVPAAEPNPPTNSEVPAAETEPTWHPVTAEDFAPKGSMLSRAMDAVSSADDKVNTWINRNTADTSDATDTTDEATPAAEGVDYTDHATYGHAAAAGLASMATFAHEVATTADKAVGVGLYALDHIGAETHTYDWWNRNFTEPARAQVAADRATVADEVSKSGVLGVATSSIGTAATEMAAMVLTGGADKAGMVLDAGKTGLAAATNIIKRGLVRSAEVSKLPAAVRASESYDQVYQQTGDPEAAVKSSLMAGGATILGNTLPVSVTGPLTYRLISGGFLGGITGEAQREAQNAVDPASMQHPFTWGEALTNTLLGAGMGGVFGEAPRENYQLAVTRFNGIVDAAAKGNAGAARTADVIQSVSNTDGLTNAAVDAGVAGVLKSNQMMAKSHDELRAISPRYAAIYKSAVTGPGAMSPADAEAYARQSYAMEVSTNAAFDHYTEATGNAAHAGRLRADGTALLTQARATVPFRDLALVYRWAQLVRPSQMEINNVLRQTVEAKQAPALVTEQVGAHLGPDARYNAEAFAADAAARPNDKPLYFADNRVVLRSLETGGITPYRLGDGRIAILGSPEHLELAAARVRNEGIEPLTTGEQDGQQAEDHPADQAGDAVAEHGQGEGNEAVRGQAETGQPEQADGQQDGAEGDGSGVRTRHQLGDEGAGAEPAQAVSPRAAPVAEALAEAGVTHASVKPTGEVVVHPEATPEEVAKALDVAAHDTGATNTEFPEPTPAEAKSGNYRKGNVSVGGLHVRVENPDGSVRTGHWGSRPLRGVHYGYFPDTIGADGDGLDVMLTHKAGDLSREVAVITQHNPETGAFDEMKVVVGAKSRGDAMATYLRQYPAELHGKLLPNGKADVVMMPREKFTRYLKSGAVDVPPHPISGQPLFRLRKSGEFAGEVGLKANAEDMADRVAAVNAKHGTSLVYDRSHNTITGRIPTAKAAAIHRGLSRVDGYERSTVDGKPVGKQADAVEPSQEGASRVAPAQADGHRLGRAGRDDKAHRGQAEVPRAKGAERAVSDAPVFREGVSAHPVSVVAVHYSNTANLEALDPRMAGTGSAGGERRGRGLGNFGNSGDPMDRLVSFYVRTGKTLPAKEAVVTGEHPYEVQLDNIYDVRADPDGIIAASDGINKTAIIEAIHDAGYDGFLYDSLPGQPKGLVVTVIGVDGKIPVKPVGRPALRLRDGHGELYSALTRTVEAAQGAPRRGTPTQWKQWLDGAQKRGDIKAAERDWSGVDAWLSEQDHPVSREELADFIRANEVKPEVVAKQNGKPSDEAVAYIRSVALGGLRPKDAATVDRVLAEWRAGKINNREAEEQLESGVVEQDFLDALNESNTKYSNYKTRGGTNYTETLLVLPYNGKTDITRRDTYQVLVDGEPVAQGPKENMERALADFPGGVVKAVNVAKSETTLARKYSSPHWDEDNIAVHIRTDDRVEPLVSREERSRALDDVEQRVGKTMPRDPGSGLAAHSMNRSDIMAAWKSGAITAEETAALLHRKGMRGGGVMAPETLKIRHIHEVQSDWAQAARKHGVESRDTPDKLTAFRKLNREIHDAVLAQLEAGGIDPAIRADMARGLGERQRAMLVKREDEYDAAQRAYYDSDKSGKLPDLPFKQTQEWSMLGIKQAVLDAIRDGQQAIEWDSGATNADRYALSSHVDAVRVMQARRFDQVHLYIKQVGGREFHRIDGETSAIDRDKLASYIGKDLAERALKDITDDGVHDYTGLDLQVGGEGMRAFYDRMLVNEVGRWAKRFGAKVEDADIHTGEYNALLGKHYTKGFDASTVRTHRLMITDAMRKAVEDNAGLPMFMFAGERAKTADTRALDDARQFVKDHPDMPEAAKEAYTNLMTGWSQQADGHWSFEIDDSSAHLKADALRDDSGLSRSLHSERGAALGEVLDHPSLFAAYPRLADGIRVRVDHNLSVDTGAQFDPKSNTVLFHELSTYAKHGDNSAESILLHEVQHAIQSHEGWARGDNPGRHLSVMREQKVKLQEQRNILVRVMEAVEGKFMDKHGTLVGADETPEWKQVERAVQQIDSLMEQEGLADYHSMMNRAVAQYMRSAGENQAYNTQARKDLTVAQRRTVAPSITEGTPRDRQLIEGGAAEAARIDPGQRATALFEVAPDPHNTELTARFSTLPPQRRTEITHDLNRTITPDILRAIGVRADSFTSTFGGYGNEVNPSLGAEFPTNITPQDAYRAAAAAGYVFNQDSVIVLGPGMGDRVGVVHIDIAGAKDYAAVSRLYGYLRAEFGDRVSGFTGDDTGINILNFGDGDTATLANDLHAALNKLPNSEDFAVSHGETEAKFISKESNDDGESYQSWLQSEPENQTLNDLRGRATAELEAAIGRDENADAATRAAEVAEQDRQVAERAQAHHDAVVAQVAEIKREWKGATELTVVRDRSELPEPVQRVLDGLLPAGEHPPGMYYNGRVYLFSGALGDRVDVRTTILHELVGHFGMHHAETFGRDLPGLLDEVYASVKDSPAFKDILATYAHLSTRSAAGRRALAEEYIAHIAEEGSDPGTWRKFVALVHATLRRLGIKNKWSDDDIRVMLARAARDIHEGRVSDAGLESPATQFSDEYESAVSTYVGAAGRGEITEFADGSRGLEVGTLRAALRTSVIDGRVFNSVDDLRIGSPDDLAALARFAQEEGRAGVAISKEDVSRAQVEASGVPFVERPGFYELHSEGRLPESPMFSLRNRQRGSAAQEAALAKAIDYSTLNMTPWDRLGKIARDFRDHLQTGDTLLSMKQSWIDKLAPVAKLERNANGGLLLDAAQSAYKAMWLAKNNAQITAGVLKLGVPEYRGGVFVPVAGREGMMQILAPLYAHTPEGRPLDALFEAYAVATRANELIGQKNADGTSKEKHLTQPEIDELLALDKQYPQFKTVLAKLQQFNHDLLDLAVDRGAMSRTVADQWKQNMYVPFYRATTDDTAVGMRRGGGFSGQKVTTKRLVGADRAVQPVLENIVKNTSAILDKVYSNEAMRRVLGLAEGLAVERVQMPAQAIRMSADEAIGVLAKAGIIVDKSNLTRDDLDTLTTIFRPTRPLGADIVSVVEGGKNVYYRVTDQGLMRALSSLPRLADTHAILDKFLGGAKHVYTAATTLDPRFMFRIMMKDAAQSWLQTGTNPNMFKHLASNVADVMRDRTFLNTLRVAGYNGNAYYRVDELRDLMRQMHGGGWQVLNSPAQLMRAYRHLGWLSEQAARLSVAKNVVEKGGSMAEAAWQAQDTDNWQRHGDGLFAQMIMRGAPFLNAHLQGLVRLTQGMLGRDVTMSRSKAVTSFWLKAMFGLTLPSLGLALVNSGNPEYERLPDQAKDAYWHIFVGNKHYVIPKPFEAGALFASLPERVMRGLQGADTWHTVRASLGAMLGDMLGMNPVPQLITPAAEVAFNRRSLGSDIPVVNRHLQTLAPEAQMDANTAPTAVAIAHAMPAGAPAVLRSPKMVEHLIRGYTSSIGLYVMGAANAVATASGYAPPAPASRFGSPAAEFAAHLTSMELADTDTRNRYVDSVYAAQKIADQTALTVTAYVKAGHLEDARELAQREQTALQYRNSLHSIATALGKIRSQEMQINASRALDPTDKRAKLDELNAVRKRMLERAGPMADMVNDMH